ncbi:hypothetical protein [Schaalia georgiae]|uniref:hypothetical protein n=1 Tax=Schaalia georgiae TaxID=52768 RepID=UPI00103A7BDD|nr:hypothetical protein [Schaalia georgiae]
MTSIDSSSWSEFVVSELFTRIERGKGSGVGSFMDGDVPYIAASFANNGYVRSIEDADGSLTSDGNCIAMIVNGNGGIGRNTYQATPFVGSSDLQLGYHNRLNVYTGLFLVACLNKSIERYGYNFQWKRTGEAFAQETVFLPSTSDGNPDWDYMQSEMEQQIAKERGRLVSLLAISSTPPCRINSSTWREFGLQELGFKNFHGERLNKSCRIDGEIPFITAGKVNRGVAQYIDTDRTLYHNAITVDMFGNCFFQSGYCTGDDNVYFFVNDQLSDEHKLFISCVINVVTSRLYVYKEQFRQPDANALTVRLPVDSDGSPAWEYMASYVSQLLYSSDKSLTYLEAILR